MRAFNDDEIFDALLIKEYYGGTTTEAIEKVADRELEPRELKRFFERMEQLRIAIRERYSDDNN